MATTKAKYRAAIDASMPETRRAMTTVANALKLAPARRRKALQAKLDSLGELHYALAAARAAPPE